MNQPPTREPMYPDEYGLAPAWVAWFNQAYRLLNVQKGPTASRPKLGAVDAGVLYFDTTLAAAGQPIWWTGGDWVDATGAVV